MHFFQAYLTKFLIKDEKDRKVDRVLERDDKNARKRQHVERAHIA